MAGIILVSGPCGCGKTTFADALAKRLVQQDRRTVYVIHGDDFHAGFVEPENPEGLPAGAEEAGRISWEEILRFNWDCITATAERALRQDLDIVIDYVVEDELPRIRELAEQYHAKLYYIVLTAGTEELEKRIRARGDTCLIERALFLKRKLEAMPENRGHLYDNTCKKPEEAVREFVPDRYLV